VPVKGVGVQVPPRTHTEAPDSGASRDVNPACDLSSLIVTGIGGPSAGRENNPRTRRTIPTRPQTRAFVDVLPRGGIAGSRAPIGHARVRADGCQQSRAPQRLTSGVLEPPRPPDKLPSAPPTPLRAAALILVGRDRFDGVPWQRIPVTVGDQ
jgi:hypothetical protein